MVAIDLCYHFGSVADLFHAEQSFGNVKDVCLKYPRHTPPQWILDQPYASPRRNRSPLREAFKLQNLELPVSLSTRAVCLLLKPVCLLRALYFDGGSLCRHTNAIYVVARQSVHQNLGSGIFAFFDFFFALRRPRTSISKTAVACHTPAVIESESVMLEHLSKRMIFSRPIALQDGQNGEITCARSSFPLSPTFIGSLCLPVDAGRNSIVAQLSTLPLPLSPSTTLPLSLYHPHYLSLLKTKRRYRYYSSSLSSLSIPPTSTSQRMAMPPLPPELIEVTIDTVAECCPESLLDCALVSHQWTPRSTYHVHRIFRTPRITTFSTLHAFSSIVTKHPRLGALASSLEVAPDPEFGSASTFIPIHYLSSRVLPNVRHLVLGETLRWGDYPLVYRKAIGGFFSAVVTLALSCHFNSVLDLFRAIRSFKNARDVRLVYPHQVPPRWMFDHTHLPRRHHASIREMSQLRNLELSVSGYSSCVAAITH